MFVSSEPLMYPVIEYLESKRIQIRDEKSVMDLRGQRTSIDLVVITPSEKVRTLGVGTAFLAKRTAVQIKQFCESQGIAEQLETSEVSIIIADFL